MTTRPDPPPAAIELGHTLTWSPPPSDPYVGPGYPVQRWVCEACDGKAIRYRGQEYGSAIEGQCRGHRPVSLV